MYDLPSGTSRVYHSINGPTLTTVILFCECHVLFEKSLFINIDKYIIYITCLFVC